MLYEVITPYILILSVKQPFDTLAIQQEVKRIYPKYQLRNQSILKDKAEFTYEIRGKKSIETMVEPLRNIEGVEQVLLLSYRGDYVL